MVSRNFRYCRRHRAFNHIAAVRAVCEIFPIPEVRQRSRTPPQTRGAATNGWPAAPGAAAPPDSPTKPHPNAMHMDKQQLIRALMKNTAMPGPERQVCFYFFVRVCLASPLPNNPVGAFRGSPPDVPFPVGRSKGCRQKKKTVRALL